MLVMNKTHFVYPYIVPSSPVFSWELMYSIRSIYTNFKGDFDITIIGEIPSWVNTSADDLHCIEFDNSHWGKRVASRTNQKMLLAADMFDDFIWMNDDIYLVNKCTIEDFKVPRYVSSDLKYGDSEKGLNTFKKLMRYTWFQLKEKNKPNNFNYAAHTPMYFESNKLKELDKEFNITSVGDYTTLTTLAYFNYFEIPGEPVGNYRIGYWGESSQKITKETKILNHDEKGFWYNPWIVSYLNGLFPKKSPVEK